MHEMSVVTALRDQVLRHIPAHHRLVEAVVEVGSLEHLDHDVVRLVWETVAEGPFLAGSSLRLELVPLRVRCRGCGHEHAPVHPACLFCPGCGRARPQLLRGSGVVLRSLEAEPAPPTSRRPHAPRPQPTSSGGFEP